MIAYGGENIKSILIICMLSLLCEIGWLFENYFL